MDINGHAIALWLGIAGTAAGIYFPIHSELKNDQQANVAQAQQRQQHIDALNQRLANDESDIAFMKSQMPKDKQDILDAIWRVRQQSQTQQAVLYDKIVTTAEPVRAGRKMDRTEVIADQPDVKIPEDPKE